jgi:putative nucleotidyltransferase with HDIG domain
MNMTPGQIKAPSELHGNAEITIEHKEYETKLDLLYDIAQQASSASEVSDLLKEIPFIIQKILRATASSLFLVDEEKWQFRMRVVGDKKQKVLEEISHSLDFGIAGWVARNNKPLIIDDVSHDERYQESIDAINGITTKSIMAAPLGRGSKVIGVLELINKADNSTFLKEDLGLLTEFANTEALNLLISMATTLMNNFKLCQSLQNQYKNTVETLVTFADAKDPYSYGHSRRVKEYSLITAGSLQLPPEELKLIEFGALLHDIGKLGIDDRILRKPESLTTEEWYIIRKHTIKGANIVRLIPSLQNIADLILYHHERHDGKGYPEGLKAEQIPIGSQIIAVADAFETMTTDRAYRTAMSIDQAIGELNKNSGTQFAPKVVAAFISALRTHSGLLENLAHQQKPLEVLKQDISLEEASRNQLKTVDKQPVPEDTPVRQAGDIKDISENQHNTPTGEVTKSSIENTSRQPVTEKMQNQKTGVPEAVSEKRENKPVVEEIENATENTATRPVTEKMQTQKTGVPDAVSEKRENKPAVEEIKNATENTATRPVTEKAQTQGLGVNIDIPEIQENPPIIGEILKILTENTGIKPVIEKSQKQEPYKTRIMSKSGEKQPEFSAETNDLSENPETEQVTIDISKQKKKGLIETADLVKNKENQLDAAEMLKKLLGDVRTRKDLQEKKVSLPTEEISIQPKTKEAPAPSKPREVSAPVKSQEAPSPSKPREVPAPAKSQEVPALMKPADVPAPEITPETKEIQLPAEELPEQDGKETAKKKTIPKTKDIQPPVEDLQEQDNKESGKKKNDRKQAEKEAKLASKKAEQEAKKEKQEAKKAKKSKNVPKAIIDISSELFEGEVKLEITPFIDFKQTDQIKKYLKGINNVKVISQGWSEEEGYIFFLSITEPTVIGPIFQRIPGIQKVYGDGKRIIAEGKTDDSVAPEGPESNRF